MRSGDKGVPPSTADAQSAGKHSLAQPLVLVEEEDEQSVDEPDQSDIACTYIPDVLACFPPRQRGGGCRQLGRLTEVPLALRQRTVCSCLQFSQLLLRGEVGVGCRQRLRQPLLLPKQQASCLTSTVRRPVATQVV